MNLDNLTEEEIDEFTWLMKEYGAEDDKHLTSDAKRLRFTIISVVRSVLGEEGGVASKPSLIRSLEGRNP